MRIRPFSEQAMEGQRKVFPGEGRLIVGEKRDLDNARKNAEPCSTIGSSELLCWR